MRPKCRRASAVAARLQLEMEVVSIDLASIDLASIDLVRIELVRIELAAVTSAGAVPSRRAGGSLRQTEMTPCPGIPSRLGWVSGGVGPTAPRPAGVLAHSIPK